ncbi:hypothetical protein OTERR_17300 [Oryzomicrobium terrae]|uniref:Uncharacterized protein n=1 Tax=Oryzomicrobium terrae TaxID=1735038 RepID=A0A5C1E8B3_9RHOO|nr:hypothetical protein [Oryzomicrobium terrae]QEL65206.1 hypothetical protein OTERR_17300 [Oryzomicrobium terrae]
MKTLTNFLRASTLALGLALGAGLATPALAHEAHGQPQYGGVFAEAGIFQAELTVAEGGVTVYLTQHGQPIAAQGATGKLTWLAGGKKSEALLAPAGDNKLAAKGDFKAPATAVAVVTLPGQAPTTVRFAIK